MERDIARALEHVTTTSGKARQRLAELVAIESVSSDPDKADSVDAALAWIADELGDVGFGDVTLHRTGTRPVVTARLPAEAPGAPTVLIYGHVDVQPAAPLDEWRSPPFTVTERDGRLWGRGVTDDKGQLLMYLRAVEALLATGGSVPVNLMVLVDGEEEIGSPSLPGLLADLGWLGTADVALVSDSPMFGLNQPAVGYALRGLIYVEVTATALAGDLHSGQFGGAVPNAAEILVGVIATLHDADGRVTVPGFYDAVQPLAPRERDRLTELPFDERAWLDAVGALVGCGEGGYSSLERTWARPTLEINGIVSGHTGPGPKTIVPAAATAKLSARLVPDQDPHRIGQLVVEHLRRIAPPSVRLEAGYGVSAGPVRTPEDSPAVQAALQALSETWSTDACLIRDGGTIPAVTMLQENLGVPALLLGFGCPDENKHAPNEWLPLDHFDRGPAALVRLLPKLAAVLRH